MTNLKTKKMELRKEMLISKAEVFNEMYDNMGKSKYTASELLGDNKWYLINKGRDFLDIIREEDLEDVCSNKEIDFLTMVDNKMDRLYHTYKTVTKEYVNIDNPNDRFCITKEYSLYYK